MGEMSLFSGRLETKLLSSQSTIQNIVHVCATQSEPDCPAAVTVIIFNHGHLSEVA